ncbi:MAG: hypothetical protein ACTSWX_03035 [Promethearchaeota archaeon]
MSKYRLNIIIISIIMISLMTSTIANITALDITEPMKISDEDWSVGIGIGIHNNWVLESLADPISRDVFILGYENGTDEMEKFIARVHHNGSLVWSIKDPYENFFASGLALGENSSVLYNCFSKNISGTYSSFLREIDTNTGEILKNITIRENSTTGLARIEVNPTDGNHLFMAIFSYIQPDTVIYDFDLESETISWNYTLLPIAFDMVSWPKSLKYNPEDGNLYYTGIDASSYFTNGGRIYKIEPSETGTRTMYNITEDHPIITQMNQVRVLKDKIYLLGNNYTFGPSSTAQYLQIFDLNFNPIELLEFNDDNIIFNDMAIIDEKHIILGGFYYNAPFQANETLDFTSGLIMHLSKEKTGNSYKTDSIHFFGKFGTTNIATMSYVSTTGELYIGGYSRSIIENKTLGFVAKFSSVYGTIPEDSESSQGSQESQTFLEQLMNFYTTPLNWLGIGITAALVFILTLLFSLLIMGGKKNKKGKKGKKH